MLCVKVVPNDTRTHEQFLKMSVGLGLVFVCLFRFNILCFFLFSIDNFDLVLFCFCKSVKFNFFAPGPRD